MTALRRLGRRFRRPPKVQLGESVTIRVHDGTAWRVLVLEQVTTHLHEGTVATFVSAERHRLLNVTTR